MPTFTMPLWLAKHWRLIGEAIVVAVLGAALAYTGFTLALRTSQLDKEKEGRRADVAEVRATSAKAQADDLMHARAVETRQAKISQEIQDDLTSRLASARADAARYAERLRAASQADPGSGAATSVSGLPDAPGGITASGQTAELDAIACAENTVKAQSWLDWYRSVSKVEGSAQ